MSAALLPVEELLGLFELDDAGKVLYHLANSDSEPSVTSPGIEGCNFYEVVSFENMEELRRGITEFTLGAKAADSFSFDCHYDGLPHRLKVLLARIRERANQTNTKSVLVHISPEKTLTSRPRNVRGDGNERDVDE